MERAQKKADPLMPKKQSAVDRPQLRGVVFASSAVAKNLGIASAYLPYPLNDMNTLVHELEKITR